MSYFICTTWDLCEVVRPDCHALNGWDCTNWPRMKWDLGLCTDPKMSCKCYSKSTNGRWVWNSSKETFLKIWSIFKSLVLELSASDNRQDNHLVVRASSHMSQEPWPCYGEDPWLSSKGRSMGVIRSHVPSSIVWSESTPCCGTIAYFVGNKRGKDLI